MLQVADGASSLPVIVCSGCWCTVSQVVKYVIEDQMIEKSGRERFWPAPFLSAKINEIFTSAKKSASLLSPVLGVAVTIFLVTISTIVPIMTSVYDICS